VLYLPSKTRSIDLTFLLTSFGKQTDVKGRDIHNNKFKQKLKVYATIFLFIGLTQAKLLFYNKLDKHTTQDREMVASWFNTASVKWQRNK